MEVGWHCLYCNKNERGFFFAENLALYFGLACYIILRGDFAAQNHITCHNLIETHYILLLLNEIHRCMQVEVTKLKEELIELRNSVRGFMFLSTQ